MNLLSPDSRINVEPFNIKQLVTPAHGRSLDLHVLSAFQRYWCKLASSSEDVMQTLGVARLDVFPTGVKSLHSAHREYRVNCPLSTFSYLDVPQDRNWQQDYSHIGENNDNSISCVEDLLYSLLAII